MVKSIPRRRKLPTCSVTLLPAQKQFADQLVAAGEFANFSDVVRYAMRTMMERRASVAAQAAAAGAALRPPAVR